jgi:uncharacterized protein YecE (DUF72 family)
LAYVSQFVDCIEINSTFYRPPFAQTTQSWLDRTLDQEGFFFTAKLHQAFTHEGRLDLEMARQFHEGFAPLLEAGRLKHLLAQFRYDFADSPPARQQLEGIVEHFSEAFSLVLEVRHKSWEASAALAFLGELGVTVCNLDYPMTNNSFSLDQCTIGQAGYLRLHGRNYDAWFSKAGRDETYNYYYKTEELSQIKQRLTRLSESFWHMVVIGNNHYRGAELANAIELKSLLTGKKQRVPEGLLKTYPQLEGIALAETKPGYLPF